MAATQRNIQRNPSVSTRKNNAPVSKHPFNRITRNDLKIHPYHVHTEQALEAGDPARRIAFCQWVLGRPPRFVLHTLIGGEAAFLIKGK